MNALSLPSDEPPGTDSPGASETNAALLKRVHAGLNHWWARRYPYKHPRRRGYDYALRRYYYRKRKEWALSKREEAYYSQDLICWERLMTVWPSLPTGPRLWDLLGVPATTPLSQMPMSSSKRESAKQRARSKGIYERAWLGGDRTDRALMEELTTMSKTESRQLAKALIRKVEGHGFTQLRKTNDGYLYGLGGTTFLLPYSVTAGWATPKYIGEMEIKFNQALSRAIESGALATVATKEEEAIEPVPDPHDLAIEDEVPPKEEEETVVQVLVEPVRAEGPQANGKRSYEPVTCPKCGRSMKTWGRHRDICTGSASPDAGRARARRSQETAPRPTDPVVVITGRGVLAQFKDAYEALLTYIGDLETEVKVARRESAEIATIKQKMSAILGPTSRVPRG